MNTGRAGSGIGVFMLALALGASMPNTAAAQGAEGDGYLFREPRISIGLLGGWAMPRGGSEIFDFVQDELTLERSDFDAAAFGVEMRLRVNRRVGAVFGFELAESRARSEFREWVGSDDLPIEQATDFSRNSLTAGLRLDLLERGRSVSRFAWVPAPFVPWVGGGFGVTWYDFVQDGEFVDYETFDIFEDWFRSNGSAPAAYLEAGVDVSLSPRWLLFVSGRQSWASAEMSTDFVGFDDIDLAGFRVGVGLAARF